MKFHLIQQSTSPPTSTPPCQTLSTYACRPNHKEPPCRCSCAKLHGMSTSNLLVLKFDCASSPQESHHGITGVRTTETQKRGALHFHSPIFQACTTANNGTQYHGIEGTKRLTITSHSNPSHPTLTDALHPAPSDATHQQHRAADR